MKTQSLCGTWQRRVGKGTFTPVTVPFSALPQGHTEYVREFDTEETGRHIFLRFEGITYRAKVTLNGRTLGEMLPYVPYEFEVTDTVLPRGNCLLLEIEDISPHFGPTEGWENYSGIIREVSLLYRDTAWIEDVFFHCELQNSYRDATYCVELTCIGDLPAEVTLAFDGREIDRFVAAGNGKITRHLQNVRLWSPEDPALYTLTVRLSGENGESDRREMQVGFREFVCRGQSFFLNGKPVFLLGVCKHEMVGESGHVPSAEETENDLLTIRALGCNFVRLVHYPHHPRVLEMADRLGLLVSEEPGLWWSDTADGDVSAGSLEVLRRTVLRDRSHASVAFWLCFNECRFTPKFLVDSAALCRALDPTRPVSGANCMSDEETLHYYKLCGFDFYTMHPYAPSFDRAAKSAEILCDKPLVFTEWGGRYVQDNPGLLRSFIGEMQRLAHAPEGKPHLAGAFFWCFAEIHEVGRVRHSCIDGILKEGLVTIDRKPTMIFDVFREAWKSEEAIRPASSYYGYTPLAAVDGVPLHGSGGADFSAVCEKAGESVPESYIHMRKRQLEVGPRLQKEEQPGLYAVPLAAAQGAPVVFTGDTAATALTVAGLVTVPGGYPIRGAYGEQIAEMTVYPEEGEPLRVPLRNGMEITTVFRTLGSSRIRPVAQCAAPFAVFHYDLNFEDYQLQYLTLPLPAGSRVRRVEFSVRSQEDLLLLYGVWAKQPE